MSSNALDNQSLCVLTWLGKLCFLTGELFRFTFFLAIKFFLTAIHDHILFASLFYDVSYCDRQSGKESRNRVTNSRFGEDGRICP